MTSLNPNIQRDRRLAEGEARFRALSTDPMYLPMVYFYEDLELLKDAYLSETVRIQEDYSFSNLQILLESTKNFIEGLDNGIRSGTIHISQPELFKQLRTEMGKASVFMKFNPGLVTSELVGYFNHIRLLLGGDIYTHSINRTLGADYNDNGDVTTRYEGEGGRRRRNKHKRTKRNKSTKRNKRSHRRNTNKRRKRQTKSRK